MRYTHAKGRTHFISLTSMPEPLLPPCKSFLRLVVPL
jgi:hypothetical protein